MLQVTACLAGDRRYRELAKPLTGMQVIDAGVAADSVVVDPRGKGLDL